MDTADKTCVVVGASHAGVQLAESVRKNGWLGEIILIGDESCRPYQRPPLSKDFLSSDKQAKDIQIKPRALYEKLEIEIRLNTRVESIDRESKFLRLHDGSALSYDRLALTTGARVRKLSIPGSDKEGVHYLRTIDDVENIRPHLGKEKHAVIIGGGYIGLETAAALRKLGINVTIIEMMSRILQRVTTPDVSAFYHRVHTEEGVNIVTDTKVAELIAVDNIVTAVSCADGRIFPADLVIIGIGVIPNVELAKEAGLEVEENGAGIIVDKYATTSDENIVAAGDCTWHFNDFYDRWIRLESVPNAAEQSRIAGATICGKRESEYDSLPWFWSDQYDIKLQIVGLSQGFDNVVIRGNIEKGREFTAFYFDGNRLLAIDAINMPLAFVFGKKMLLEKTDLDKTKLADETISLKTLV